MFRSAGSAQALDCTYESYLQMATSAELLELCRRIRQAEGHEERSALKRRLPVVTWQAAFDGRRLASQAKPSGLFMLDIDHVDDPSGLYSSKVAGRLKELGIVLVQVTASGKGLRIVARCRPEMRKLEECQRWLAESLGVEYDAVCKDFARCSYMVHDSYTLYMDAKGIWQDDPKAEEVYSVGDSGMRVRVAVPRAKKEEGEEEADQREGLFGGPSEYKGVPYGRIVDTWFEQTGGVPVEGERNARLYQLALRLRYITDFNEVTLFRVMPRCGLGDAEVREIVRHALSATRAAKMPQDLQDVLELIDRQIKLGPEREDESDLDEIITSTQRLPHLPPVFKEWCDVAPEDFKQAVVLCQLPILGALGSRLRAEYLDGRLHSPSFQVSLEAPQASGKSFLGQLVDYELAQMKEADAAAREEERQYQEKMNRLRMLNVKLKKSEEGEIPEKPKVIVRYVPATMSITKLFMRMSDAQGLHLFAFAPEIDTVLKAFKRGFSSFSDALRMSFDNDETGQDYASDQSFSGMVRLYYNCLFSGTPKAMCRFYPDVEDGLVSRVLFCTLPDQFGKPMPVWKTFTPQQRQTVDIGLVRLNEVTLQGQDVQPEHVMKMGWLNKTMEAWVVKQQQEALRQDDRTRDIFCRRAAVVGFRAGMLGWFLWGEHNTPTIRRYVGEFAVWVANSMLNQHLLRFNVQGTHSNVNRWENVLKMLDDEFTRDDVQKALARENVGTKVRVVIYNWRLAGLIETIKNGDDAGKAMNKQTKFKKIKK